jgi:hypothetical protein
MILEKMSLGQLILLVVLFLGSTSLNAQVTSSINTDSIKIGEQIIYKIQVETDTTDFVAFPEGQTFLPLEVVESFKVDTTINEKRMSLIKKYGLTQFDSGSFTIPRQKVAVANKFLFTDSLKVEVRNVEIDTTKQGLYDIKPLTSVEKSPGNWWKYLLIVLLVLSILGFLLYWFIWRKKPLSEEEKIALLPPYDRAKLALKRLEESDYLKNEALKDYYSELTLIIRKYLDEKVYDHSLESTTDELIDRLILLKEGNKIDINKETIQNIESILKRADLVKFAKAAPDIALAELDKQTIESEIDHVKEALPEPSEEEKLLDQKYREEVERKKKRRKIVLTSVIGIAFILMVLGGFSIKYGFSYVKDTIIGHDSKELLESKEWVTSEYGAPSLIITTPKVLKRSDLKLSEEMQQAVQDSQMFVYGSLMSNFYIVVNSLFLNPQIEFDLNKAVDNVMVQFEAQGAQNIITKQDEFVTPNGAEGIDIHGTMILVNPDTNQKMESKYSILNFYNNGAYQQVQIIYDRNDEYADQIAQRVINSIELIKPQA